MAEATSSSALAVRERGYASDPSLGGGSWSALWAAVQQEPNLELAWPASIKVYNRMRREDAQVRSTLSAVTLPLRATTWRLDPGDAPEHVVAHVARDLGLPVRGMKLPPAPRQRDRFSWAEHLRLALLQLPFGHMIFEQVYRLDDSGLAHVRKLGPRFPHTIARWNVARDGGLDSVVQYGPGSLATGQTTLPVSRLVVYSHEREGGEWWGQSVLRAAYKPWMLKDIVLRVGVQAIDRNGMGVPVYEGAEGETDLTAGEDLAQRIRSGDNAGAAIPHGAKLTLAGVTGATADPLPSVRYFDEQIGRSVLAHFLNLGQQTGSWALGETFANFFLSSLNAVADGIADVATQHIVEDLVDVNWGPDMPAPRIVYDSLLGESGVLAEVIRKLVEAGVLTPDEALEAHSRVVYGLPDASPHHKPQESS